MNIKVKPSTAITFDSLLASIKKIKEKAPIIHNITNFVSMQTIANVLLAAGASPIMAHAIQELNELSTIADSLIINIGTLDDIWLNSIELAQQIALKKKTPIILDPVGAGATQYRTTTAKKVLALGVNVLRGNAAEIMALNNRVIKTKGVDALYSTEAALDAAKELNLTYNCVVVVSGKVDIIVSHQKEIFLNHGSSYFTQVTGMGCALTSLIGALCATNKDSFDAAIAAVVWFTLAGEIAEKKSSGPGSFYPNLLDILANSANQLIAK